MGEQKEQEIKTVISHHHGNKLSGVLVVFVVVLSIVIGMKFGSEWQQRKIEKKNHQTMVTSDTIRQQMEQIGELATVSYYYTNMAKYEDAFQWLEHNVPFTKKSFIVSYDGTIKAGIDMNAVKIQVEDQVVTITIPQALITSHEVDMDSVVLYDEKNSVFNGLSADDVTSFIGEEKKLMEEKAYANGVLEKAQDNATSIIKAMMNKYFNDEETEKSYQLKIEVEKSEIELEKE